MLRLHNGLLIICLLATLILIAYSNNDNLPMSNIEESEQTSEIEEDENIFPSHQDVLAVLTTRAKALSQDIPFEYLDSVAQHTQFPYSDPGYSYEYFENMVNIQTIQNGDYYIVLLVIPGQFYWAGYPHEYHVFFRGVHKGIISHGQPSSFMDDKDGEQRILELNGHVWLIENCFVDGSTGSSYGVFKERWYEISHPSLKEVLQFTSDNSSRRDITEIYYEAKVTNIEPSEENESSFIFDLTLEWSEEITTCSKDDILLKIPLLSGKGKVDYQYDEVQCCFVRRTPPSHSNYVYDDKWTTHGRSDEEILFMYMDQIVDISENGSQEQKDWLNWFLQGYNLDMLGKLSEWQEAYSTSQ